MVKVRRIFCQRACDEPVFDPLGDDFCVFPFVVRETPAVVKPDFE